MTTSGINTVGSESWRLKFYSANLQQVLRNAVVAEKICKVDNSDSYTIRNPYGSQVTATIGSLANGAAGGGGTYAVNDYTVTNDTLTVTDFVNYGEQVYDFEEVLNNYDLFAERANEQAYGIAYAINYMTLNVLLDTCTGTYTTQAGGFTTPGNINTIMANLTSKVAGYQNAFSEMFLVIENTDLVGFQIAGATNGFTMADMTLNNGFAGRWMGVDIYVVRSGLFVSSVIGTHSVTCSGHRVFGVKGAATYACPRGIKHEEKSVSGKTGKEIVTYAYFGFKLWTQNAGLVVDITLA
jgi:hypothetical protein